MPSPTSVWSPTYRALTFGTLLALGLTAFESLAVSTAMPKIAAELGGIELYGWAFSLFQLANIVGIFWAGQTSDRRGSAFPFTVAIGVFGVGLLCSALAQNMPMLLLGRVLQGWGAGGVATVVYVVVQQGYPAQLRASMLVNLSNAWIVPTLVGPLLASFLAEHLSWRAVFWVIVPLLLPPLLTALPALQKLQPAAPSGSTSLLPRAVAMSLGTSLLLAGLTAQTLWGVMAVVVGIGVMAYAFRHLFPPGILTARPGVSSGIALRGLVLWLFVGFEAFMPLGLKELRGVPLQTAAVALMMGSLSWSVGSWIQARLEALHGRAGRVLRVRWGFSLMGLGGLLATLTILPLGLWVGWAAVGWLLTGLGIGVCFAAITLEVMDGAKPDQKGLTSSWLQCGDVLCGALSAGIMGTILLFAHKLGWPREGGYLLMFAALLCAPLLGLLIAHRLHTPSASTLEAA